MRPWISCSDIHTVNFKQHFWASTKELLRKSKLTSRWFEVRSQVKKNGSKPRLSWCSFKITKNGAFLNNFWSLQVKLCASKSVLCPSNIRCIASGVVPSPANPRASRTRAWGPSSRLLGADHATGRDMRTHVWHACSTLQTVSTCCSLSRLRPCAIPFPWGAQRAERAERSRRRRSSHTRCRTNCIPRASAAISALQPSLSDWREGDFSYSGSVYITSRHLNREFPAFLSHSPDSWTGFRCWLFLVAPCFSVLLIIVQLVVLRCILPWRTRANIYSSRKFLKDLSLTLHSSFTCTSNLTLSRVASPGCAQPSRVCRWGSQPLLIGCLVKFWCRLQSLQLQGYQIWAGRTIEVGLGQKMKSLELYSVHLRFVCQCQIERMSSNTIFHREP